MSRAHSVHEDIALDTSAKVVSNILEQAGPNYIAIFVTLMNSANISQIIHKTHCAQLFGSRDRIKDTFRICKYKKWCGNSNFYKYSFRTKAIVRHMRNCVHICSQNWPCYRSTLSRSPMKEMATVTVIDQKNYHSQLRCLIHACILTTINNDINFYKTHLQWVVMKFDVFGGEDVLDNFIEKFSITFIPTIRLNLE